MTEEAFFALHRDMPRQGPGAPEDVAWAIGELALAGVVRILDAGCGPGADLATFAALLPEARLEGVDAAAHLVEEARKKVPRAELRVGDMARLEGPHDLIWCAGALYFLGVSEGLRGWRGALVDGGAVAFSEPVLLDTRRETALDFWRDYEAISDLAGILERVAVAGYEVVAHRLIVGEPWARYYAPLSARVAELRPEADAALREVLDRAQREIDLWRAAPEALAYALVLARPV